MSQRVLAILGSYRPGHTIDRAAQAVLDGARERGAEVEVVQLRDCPIAFCTNCRACTQAPGAAPGKCPLDDAMADLIARIERADALVLAAPVNFFAVNALFKRFMERLVGYAYWPWGKAGPHLRRKQRNKRAVLLTSTAMPGLMARFTTSAMKSLTMTAKTVGARPVGKLYLGMVAQRTDEPLAGRMGRRARQLGARLVG